MKTAIVVLLMTVSAWGQKEACVRSLSPFTGPEVDQVVAQQFEKRGFHMHSCGQVHEPLEVWFYSYNATALQGPTQFWITTTHVQHTTLGSISTFRPSVTGSVWTVVWVENWEPQHRRLSPSLGSAAKGIAKWSGSTRFVRYAGTN